MWYYSTRPQIEELLEVLDKDKWERDLVMCIKEIREEIVKQMLISEELTNASKGTRKSAIDVEIGILYIDSYLLYFNPLKHTVSVVNF